MTQERPSLLHCETETQLSLHKSPSNQVVVCVPLISCRWCRKQLQSYFSALLPCGVQENLYTSMVLVPPCKHCQLPELSQLLPAWAENSLNRRCSRQWSFILPKKYSTLWVRNVGKLFEWCLRLNPKVLCEPLHIFSPAPPPSTRQGCSNPLQPDPEDFHG